MSIVIKNAINVIIHTYESNEARQGQNKLFYQQNNNKNLMFQTHKSAKFSAPLTHSDIV